MTPLERAWRGSRNDWRLHVLSVFSVSVAFVCMASALLVVVNVAELKDSWARAGRASVYLKAAVKAEEARTVEAALRKTPGVRSVRYVTSESARDELLSASADTLLGELPKDAFPASLEVRLDAGVSRSRLREVVSSLAALPQVESVETYETWTDRLATLLKGGVTAAMLLAAVVFGAVISVVGSTLRLSLQRRRIEVEVLQLVGATDEYVRRPFIIEGTMQGLIGASLATLLLGVLYAIVAGQLDPELAQLVGISPTFLPWTWVLAMVAVGGGLGAVAAYVSLRRLMVT